MKSKLLIALILAPPLIFGAVFLFVLYEGPRMTVQHHIRDFQMSMPLPPAGTATVTPPVRLPSPGEASGVRNPLQVNSQTLAAGRVYYTYYCVFCHGEAGAGDGPVGQSYLPTPSDLRAPRLAGYRDGDLLRGMLTGVGHEPVLEKVVPPEHRWYLVAYLRTLQKSRSLHP